MTRLVLGLIPIAFVLAWPLTVIVRRISASMGAMDAHGVPGQVKAASRRVPNTGGIAIFAAIIIPIVLGLALLVPLGASHDGEWREEPGLVPADLHEHLAGLKAKAGDAAIMLACLLGVHLLGVFDDRRPMGPWIKLCAMLIAATVMVVMTETRMLTMLDAHVGGPWLSVVLTVLWIGWWSRTP